MKKTDPPIVVEAVLPVGQRAVWRALIDLDKMHRWYFENLPEFEAVEGFEVSFPVYSETRTFTHRWTVLEIVDQKSIKLRWQYKEYPGDSTVTFSLADRGAETLITVTCEVLADFPEDIPEFERESCIGGWQYFLGRLEGYLSEK